MDEREIAAQKSVEFYSASVAAWYASALEHDKSVFTLAAGGIGLLVTLLTTVGFDGWVTFIFFALAIGSLLVTLACILVIFKKNQSYVQAVLAGGQVYTDPKLARLDRAALVSFGLGVVFAVGVGISAAWISFQKQTQKGHEMANEKQSVPTFDSVLGAARLQPDFTKSFHGAGNLAPSVTAPAPSAPTASAPAASAPAASAPIASAPAASAATAPAPAGTSGSAP
jgi:hypothetical protein